MKNVPEATRASKLLIAFGCGYAALSWVLFLKAEPAELALTAEMKEDQKDREPEADSERGSNHATKPGPRMGAVEEILPLTHENLDLWCLLGKANNSCSIQKPSLTL